MADAARGRFADGRHAGVIAPLFSIPSAASWGLGEIPDLPLLARWLEAAGLDFIQLLPINEMQAGQSSPYSGLSAMAIDPIFIAVERCEDFRAAGGLERMSAEGRESVTRLQRSRRVDYELVRATKREALHLGFDHFDGHASQESPGRAAFDAFVEREGWWLDTYALFRALHDERAGCYWREWEQPLRDRDPAALTDARDRLASNVRYYQYVQWLADEQWQQARSACGAVGLFGDFPFMVNGHSADVWARQGEFHLDASVGVPPAPESPEGQDWGLPPYRWEVVAPGGYEWLAQRTRRCAELFDGFRVDHLVGFYRTFIRAHDGPSGFSPPDEAAQLAQGEALMALFRSHGSRIIAEDLGVVPDFVRVSQTRQQVPGLKVVRWEREWEEPGRPFRDPRAYAPCSVAISGTHDTESMAEWWSAADPDERQAVLSIMGESGDGLSPADPFSDRIRDALLSTLFHAGSDFTLVALPDIFGWRDRINVPSSVDDENWTWRLPWPVETLTTSPEGTARAAFLRTLASASKRTRNLEPIGSLNEP